MPASYRELVAELVALGVEVKARGSRRGNGSHAEIRAADGKFISVLAHHNLPGFDAEAWVARVTGRPAKRAASDDE
jgi:hypothetical protein